MKSAKSLLRLSDVPSQLAPSLVTMLINVLVSVPVPVRWGRALGGEHSRTGIRYYWGDSSGVNTRSSVVLFARGMSETRGSDVRQLAGEKV